jgi:hypothetical protein
MLRLPPKKCSSENSHERDGDTGLGRGWRLAAVVALGLAVAGCDKCTNLFGPGKAGASACTDDAPKPR